MGNNNSTHAKPTDFIWAKQFEGELSNNLDPIKGSAQEQKCIGCH